MAEAGIRSGQGVVRSVAEGAQSIGFAAWIIAAITLPVAFILQAYGTVLLIVILVVFWQFLAAALAIAGARRRTDTRSGYRCRLTSWGLVYGGVCAVFLVVAMHWGINLVFLTCSFLLGAALCAAAYPWMMMSRLNAKWSVPDRTFAGEQFAVGVELRNDKRLLSAFGLRVGTADGESAGADDGDAIYRLTPGQVHETRVRQFIPERGLRRLNPVDIRTGFPFGLLEVTKRCRYNREVLFLPHIGHINDEMLRRHSGGEARWLQDLRRIDPEGEFRSLREYRPGDNPKRIHWPTSARLQKLYVREFERREMPSVLILLDSFVPEGSRTESAGRRERYERAVSFAATLAWLLNQRSIYYAFASYCPHLVTLPYDTGFGHLHSVLEALALADTTPEHDVGDLARALSFHEVSTGGICLASAGPLSRPGASALLGSLGRGAVVIDVCEPEFDEIYTH
jgi:uncharacterized protein (DUF58 family)